ncbi:MAG: hypothetical protein ABI175_13905 [Polyangiales bacterium]
MPRPVLPIARQLVALAPLAAASLLVALAPACRKGPTYDDAPIGREDRPRAIKKDEPKVEYDRGEVCKRLATVTDAGSLPADEQAGLSDICLSSLAALKGRDRKEFDCRCKCIMNAADIGAIELCQRGCALDSIEEICRHAVGSQEKSNDAGVVDGAHKLCVERLERLKKKDEPRFDCTRRCLMTANGKNESLFCDDRCDPANAGKTFGDAGTDADAEIEPPASE